MNYKNDRLWSKVSGIIASVLLLLGCQSPSGIRSASQDIHDVLQEGSNENATIRNKSATKLPDDVRKAFMPRLDQTQGKNVPSADKRFDLVADQVPAKAFFLSLVEDTPYNITVHPNVDGKISLQLKKVTIFEVLDTVRSVYGFDFRQTAQGVEILPATLQTRAFAVNYLDVNRSGSSQTQVSGGSLSTAGTSGTSGGSTTTGSGSTSTGNSTSTVGGSSSESSGLNSIVNTTTKADFWTELKTAVQTMIGTGEGRTVAVSPLSSLIVVQAMPDELHRVEEFLKSAELSLNRQVILEAKIIEVELDDGFQAGINWSMVSGRLNMAQTGGSVVAGEFTKNGSFPIKNSGSGGPFNINPGQPKANIASGVGAFGGVFALATNYKNLGTFIELLGAQGKIHVLSSPRVATMNNQKALMKVGSDRFFITNVSTTSTASTGATSTTPNVTFDSFFSGISLDVTPHVTESEEITLHIHPTVSSVEDDRKEFTVNGENQSFPLAKSSVRESDSMVKAKNGEMVILGGLMQNQNSQLRQGIPLLKDLPVIGNLFSHTVQISRKSELVILLRPIIVNDSTSTEQVDNSLDRFQKMNEEIIKDENKYNCQGANC